MTVCFEIVLNAKCRLIAHKAIRRTAVGGCPKVCSYHPLAEQLHCEAQAKNSNRNGLRYLCMRLISFSAFVPALGG